jgi:hypothetical protein
MRTSVGNLEQLPRKKKRAEHTLFLQDAALCVSSRMANNQGDIKVDTSDIDEKSLSSLQQRSDGVPDEVWKPILRKIDLHILPLVYLQYLIMRIVRNFVYSPFVSFIVLTALLKQDVTNVYFRSLDGFLLHTLTPENRSAMLKS